MFFLMFVKGFLSFFNDLFFNPFKQSESIKKKKKFLTYFSFFYNSNVLVF